MELMCYGRGQAAGQDARPKAQYADAQSAFHAVDQCTQQKTRKSRPHGSNLDGLVQLGPNSQNLASYPCNGCRTEIQALDLGGDHVSNGWHRAEAGPPEDLPKARSGNFKLRHYRIWQARLLGSAVMPNLQAGLLDAPLLTALLNA